MNKNNYYAKQKRRAKSLSACWAHNRKTLEGMNMELVEEWGEREVRRLPCVMWKFTDKNHTYYLGAPKDETNPTTYITDMLSDNMGTARSELSRLLK